LREKREHQRKPLDLEVECRIGDGTVFHGRSRDLSVGGMYIVAAQQPPFGSPVSITLVLGGGMVLVVPGTARWSKTDGFGVQFGLLGAKETHAIARIMAGGRPTLGSYSGVESERGVLSGAGTASSSGREPTRH